MNHFNIFKPIFATPFRWEKIYFEFRTKYFALFISQTVIYNQNPRLIIWWRFTNNPNIGYNARQIFLY